jgi:hypothetical protein
VFFFRSKIIKSPAEKELQSSSITSAAASVARKCLNAEAEQNGDEANQPSKDVTPHHQPPQMLVNYLKYALCVCVFVMSSAAAAADEKNEIHSSIVTELVAGCPQKYSADKVL